MEFTPEQISSFRRLYKDKFNEDLSNIEVIEQLNKLIGLVTATYKPITIDNYLESKLTEIKQYEKQNK